MCVLIIINPTEGTRVCYTEQHGVTACVIHVYIIIIIIIIIIISIIIR